MNIFVISCKENPLVIKQTNKQDPNFRIENILLEDENTQQCDQKLVLHTSVTDQPKTGLSTLSKSECVLFWNGLDVSC